jgi:hypothetical protein
MKYYVYTLSYESKVFYVGKGTDNRMYIHEKKALKGIKSNNNSSLFEKILSVIKSSSEIEYQKIFETDDECLAYKIEYETIDSFGLENLCNLTKDYIKTSVSQMVKNSLSKSEKWANVIQYKKSKQSREHYRQMNLGEKNPRYGKHNTIEHMNAIKKSLVGIPKSDEHKKKISDAITGIKRSKETKIKLSESLKNSSKFKEKVQSENFKQKHRENTKKRHDELITYVFECDGVLINHKGGLKNLSLIYDISFYYLKKLRYGEIDNHKGWKFISMSVD